MKDWQYWVSSLNLTQHPEGGYYKEIYKCPQSIDADRLQGEYDGTRRLSTSIYFLLPSGEVSRFHRLKSDELWYYHAGSSVTVHMIDTKGIYREVKLGLDIESGEMPQVIIPRGSIFGATVNAADSFCLVGCMVSPGFDFRDFELLPREGLLKTYPKHKDIILKLT